MIKIVFLKAHPIAITNQMSHNKIPKSVVLQHF